MAARSRARRPPQDPGTLTTEDLWKLWRKTPKDEIRQELIRRHQTLVRQIAEREVKRFPRSVDVDDLVQEGNFGLMDAIKRFDPTRGIKFKTYCSTRVRGAMIDAVRSQDWVPRLERQRTGQIEKMRKEFRERHGREPSDAEVAARLDLKERDVQRTQPRQMHSVSDRRHPAGEDGEPTLDSLAESKEISPLEAVHRGDLMDELGRILSEKERRILTMYYQRGLTLRQIGAHLSITESRVCQIHANMIQRLRRQFGDRADQFHA
jgi:RNA polymerase sigma factor for flagellar operon FliA